MIYGFCIRPHRKFDKPSGVVLIGKAQEKALGYTARRKDQGTKVWFEYSRHEVRVTYYYFYILDEEFGLFFIKVCTYFPFDVKVGFNGHEWAKQQLRQAGIGFEALSNGFLTCEDPEYLQSLCRQLDAAKIQALFDRWVAQLPWPLTVEQQAAGYRHQLSIWQMEVSRTQVFADPEQGWALVETLIRDNLDLGRPDRVSLIFERQVTKRTPSEFHTRVLREGVQPTIRIHYKHSALKQYLKDGRALRTEMMFNNTQDFGLTRGLKNCTCLFELGCSFNQRLLEQEQVSQDSFLSLQEMIEQGSANCVLIKPNQVGTLTNTFEAVHLAHSNGLDTVMSHRSGETTDATIAHLATAFQCIFIKTGVVGGERTAKLNELIRIEEQIA